ncbi:MAG: HD domain-containing protein [Candidatus Micrarchaeota archaeon]
MDLKLSVKNRIIAIAKDSYEDEDYKYHILPVVKNALILGKKLNADLEVVEAAAYLHDIGRATKRVNFVKENEHHITGAAETKKILEELRCPDAFVQKVCHCVLAHRGRKGPDPETLEAKIIANADAMAHFDTFLDLFDFFLKSSGSFEEAILALEQKMDRDWNKKLTLPEAKKTVREKYEAILVLIKSQKEYFENEKKSSMDN